MNKPFVLTVEDDTSIRNLITTALKTNDYRFRVAGSAKEGIMEASTYNPDIVLLDLGLPDMDGIEVIRNIRSWSNLPIIVISARSEDRDKIEALDAGADDYLTKPFSVEELLARLRTTQRRLTFMSAGIEYKLLCLLSKNVGKVLTHQFITQHIWGRNWGSNQASLRVFMATLRKKLEPNKDSPEYIQTHIGVGYRMVQVD